MCRSVQGFFKIQIAERTSTIVLKILINFLEDTEIRLKIRLTIHAVPVLEAFPGHCKEGLTRSGFKHRLFQVQPQHGL